MIFLGSLFLLALPLVAVPVFIHLMRRRRRDVTPWGAMQFLRVKHNRDTRLSNWDRWLLMALRMLALTCLIVALAQPALKIDSSGGASLSPQLLMIDDTRSTLAIESNGEANFESIRRAALNWLAEVPAGTPIEVWAVGTPPRRFGSPTIAGSTGQFEIATELRSFVPRGGGANFTTNLRRATSSAMFQQQEPREPIEPGGNRSRVSRLDTWLLTDAKRAGWPENLSAIQMAGDKRNHLHVVTIADQSSAARSSFQLAVRSVVAQRSRIAAGQSTKVSATIVNFGNQRSTPCTAIWSRGESPLATSPVAAIQPNASVSVETEVTLDEPGTSTITVSLRRKSTSESFVSIGDPLPADDEGGSVVQAMGRQPILVISGRQRGSEQSHFARPPTESDYLAAALGQQTSGNDGRTNARDNKGFAAAGSWRSLYQPVFIQSDELDDVQWHQYPVVFVLSDAALPDLAMDQVVSRVRSGCGLWITVGQDSDLQSLERLLGQLGIGDGGPTSRIIGDLVLRPEMDSMDRIHPPESTDDVIAALADTERLDLDEVRIRRRRQLQLPASDQTRTLLRTFSGDPLTTISTVGRGQVALQGIALDPSWSNFPLSNAYVVYITNLMEHLASPSAERHHLVVGQMIRANVQNREHRFEIEAPDGNITEVIALAGSSFRNLKSGVIRFEQTDRPGRYTLLNRDQSDGNLNAMRPVHYWVEPDAEESEIFEDITASLGEPAAGEQLHWVNANDGFDPKSLLQAIPRTDSGATQRSIWPWLLMAMFVAILLETFLAGYASLRRYGQIGTSTNEVSASLARSGLTARGTPMSSAGNVAPLLCILPANETAMGDQLTVIEGLTTEGWMPIEPAIVVGLGIAIAAVFWLWRQRQLLGGFTTALVACLRLAVVATAIWMLIEPSWTKTETLSRQAEILWMSDTSGSMKTLDPLASASTQRWIEAIDSKTSVDDSFELQAVHFQLQMAVLGEQRWGEVSSDALRSISQRLAKLSDSSAAKVASVREKIEWARQSSDELSCTQDAAERQALLASRSEALDLALVELRWLVRSDLRPTTSTQSAINLSRQEYANRLLQKMDHHWTAADEGDSPMPPVRIRKAVFSDRVTPILDEDQTTMHGSSPAKDIAQSGGSMADFNGVTPDDPRTDLSQAIAFAGSLAASRPIAAVVMISEGQHNAASALTPVEAASTLPGVPLFTVAIGDSSRRRDILVHRVNAPPVVYTDDAAKIEVIVSAYQCENDSVDVLLKLGEEVLQTKTAHFDSFQSDAAIEFDVPRRGEGRHEYFIDVESIQDEVNLQNNQGFVAIETIKSKLRVLIADGRPRWESRYLEQLFRRDPRIELEKVLLKPSIKTSVGTKEQPLPDQVDSWAKFDVVFLGDLPPSVLTKSVRDAVTAYVKGGGRLVVIAGEESMPQAYLGDDWFDLLPVIETAMPVSIEHRPSPTMDGMLTRMFRLEPSVQESRSIWQRAMRGPRPGFVSPYHAAKPSATVLATLGFDDDMGEMNDDEIELSSTKTSIANEPTPIWLALHQFGRGQVAYLSSPVTYRLRIRRGDQHHHQFWGQLVRYMTSAQLAAGSDTIQIQADRTQYEEGAEPLIRVRLRAIDGQPIRGASLNLNYQQASKSAPNRSGATGSASVAMSKDEQVPGTYVATIPALSAGVYEAWVSGDSIGVTNDDAAADEAKFDDKTSVKFTVQSSSGREMIVTQANPALLKQIAETSGGLAIAPRLVQEIPKVVSMKPEVTEVRQSRPLWNRWVCLWIIVGCLSGEWFLRRRRGLV